ncbi:MAG: hypothetical protein RLZZ385_1258 [Pseudomonadota bacterium]|jgi:biopolymer transport protein ExbB
MNRLLVVLSLLAATTAAHAQPLTLSELIDSVREGSATRRAELQEREQQFIEARDERAALLREATRLREEAEAESDRLRTAYSQGEEELADLENLLDQSAGDLRDVFAVVHQIASDAVPLLQNSLVSAQFTDRLPSIEILAGTETLPTAAQLRQLWLVLLDEMNESGRVARFDVPIITATGQEEVRQVTRIGTFSAIADGEFLRFLPESGRLLALPQQPIGVNLSAVQDFENGVEPLVQVPVDPSRGSILSLIVQTPGLTERMQQGGVIGYIILGLGAVGLLLGLYRLLVVAVASRHASHALKNGDQGGKHAIGQLQKVAQDPGYLADAEAMSAKMDEIVTTAAQRLKWGLSTLAIIAAVSPLLGLLGTVTGMIETFQVITLFGAGDPRLMSGGISLALITTQQGLSVAIPILLIHSFVQSRANQLISSLDELAADLFARSRAGDARAV